MLGDRRLGHRQPVDEVSDPPLARAEKVQDPAAVGFSKHLESHCHDGGSMLNWLYNCQVMIAGNGEGMSASQSGRHRRHSRRVTFTQYLEFRLGTDGGRSAWFNFFVKSFGARSFSEFWRLWNPVYGYILYYFSYRPLARVLPRPLAVLITFAASGVPAPRHSSMGVHEMSPATRRDACFHHVRPAGRYQRHLPYGSLTLACVEPRHDQPSLPDAMLLLIRWIRPLST